MPAESELVLHSDGSVYHLRLKDEHIADNVILVGDPSRVDTISSLFDSIDIKISNREFTTHTGTFRGKRITALSTGIGTDNIDIVVNELDAAINFDPITREPKENLRSLNLIRIGTCGGLHASIDSGDTAITEYSIGLDGVRHFYDIEESDEERHVRIAYEGFTENDVPVNRPYVAVANSELLSKLEHLGKRGITLCANGFFGPQGRQLRIPLANPNFNDEVDRFEINGLNILNYEMESSALYALGGSLGHNCICLCVVIANRKSQKFGVDYQRAVGQLVCNVLDSI